MRAGSFIVKLIFVPLFFVTLFAAGFETAAQNGNNNEEAVYDYLGEEIPDSIPKLFAPGIVSTSYFEHSSPSFSPEGNEVYWTQLTGEHGSEAVIKFMQKKNNSWSSPQTATYFSGYDDMYPVFSFNGDRIYFTSGRSKESKDIIAGERGIWFIEKEKDRHSEPHYIGFDSLDIYGLSVAANGNLYFMAQHKRQAGLYDLYYSECKNGKYSSPAKLDEPINTTYYEDCPYIAADESYLIFESGRPGGYGRIDIYISFKTTDGQWTSPKNLGAAINSSFNERFSNLSPDGKYFFFASNRYGNYDIYWVDSNFVKKFRNEN